MYNEMPHQCKQCQRNAPRNSVTKQCHWRCYLVRQSIPCLK